jgi:leucyl-tRNA synthetase
VHATTGEKLERIVTKMSKRYGNVVNPDDVVREYGADTLRLYEMYMGPLADTKPWNPKDVPGVYRFLQRSWRLCVPEFAESGPLHAHLRQDRPDDAAIEKLLHRTIAKVDGDIERLAFNTAISAMMIFVNEATKAMDRLSRSQLLRYVQTLQPFAPHIAEELWHRLGGQGLLARAAWPAVDPAMLVDDEVEIAVQVLGKVRGRAMVPTGARTTCARSGAAGGRQLSRGKDGREGDRRARKARELRREVGRARRAPTRRCEGDLAAAGVSVFLLIGSFR